MDWKMKPIFQLLLHATTTFTLVATQCLDHDYTVDAQTFNWPAAENSDVWIPSNCLNEKNQLVFRKCEADQWEPDNTEFQSSCRRRMNTDFRICPVASLGVYEVKGPTIETFCYEIPNVAVVGNPCDLGHISFTDLNIDERQLLLEHMSPGFLGSQWSLAHGDSVRWHYSDIFTLMDYRNGEVRLQNSKCGSYGLPLTVTTENVPVYCAIEDEPNVCNEMCLSLNVTRDQVTRLESAIMTVEKCSGNAARLNIFRPLTAQYECPFGYYRMEFSFQFQPQYPRNRCYSIQMFNQSIPVRDVESKSIIETCKGEIMQMKSENELLLFVEMSRQMSLVTDDNRCLFGLTDNDIVKYSDWETIDLTEIAFNNFNWDESMNYSEMLTGDGNDIYLAVNPNGVWTWSTSTVSCVVCMVENVLNNVELPTLRLKYDFLGKAIELHVTNADFLFRERSSDTGFICFAFIGHTYVPNLTVYPIGHSRSNYSIENVGHGRYWCFGHTLYTDFVVSNVYDVYGMVFAFIVFRRCENHCAFGETDLQDLTELLEVNYQFVKVLNSAVVHFNTVESETEYYFVAHVRLVLQDDAIAELDTNLISPLTQRQLETVFIYERLNEMLTRDEMLIRNETLSHDEMLIRNETLSHDEMLFRGEMLTDDEMLTRDEVYGLQIESVKSTEYCLHESTLSLGAIIWKVSNIGETVQTSLLCPRRQSQIITRTCSEDNVYGSYWNLANDPLCYTNVSRALLDLYIYFNDTHEDLEHLEDILQENVQILLPIDVFLTSRIVTRFSIVSIQGIRSFELISSIFNSLMQVNEEFLNIAASLNSTNILLEFLDAILLSGHFNSQFSDGNVVINSPLLKIFILNPFNGNGSGVALYRPQSLVDFDSDFTNYSVRYVHPNESIEEIFNDWKAGSDLVVGSYLSDDMLNSLRNITVAMIVFFNDKLFQPNAANNENQFKTNGKVISVTIFENDLPSNIPIFFEANHTDDSTCGYWSLSSDAWSNEGCTLRQVSNFEHLALCECNHLTHFGYLVDSYKHEISEINERALTSITIVGSSISLFGSLGIFVTATTFPNWRQKLSSKILIHFSASIALQMCLVIVSNVDTIANNNVVCIVMGSLNHYSVLVMHFWMLIIGYFQFKRYVVVFNFTVNNLLLKSTLFGWFVPLIPVIVVLVSRNYSLYIPNRNDKIKVCYPTGWALHYGVLAPIGLIFVVDVIVYVTVIVSLNRGYNTSTCVSDTAKFRKRLSQIRLFVFLFFALGLSWIFGLMSNVLPSWYLAFTFLFCITSTVQGVILFFYFIILDPHVRNLWLKYFKNLVGSE